MVLVRWHLELYFIHRMCPLDPALGYNRVKMWVGTFSLGYNYYIKLEMLNSNFSDFTRIPIMGASLLFMTEGVARLQRSGTF